MEKTKKLLDKLLKESPELITEYAQRVAEQEKEAIRKKNKEKDAVLNNQLLSLHEGDFFILVDLVAKRPKPQLLLCLEEAEQTIPRNEDAMPSVNALVYHNPIFINPLSLDGSRLYPEAIKAHRLDRVEIRRVEEVDKKVRAMFEMYIKLSAKLQSAKILEHVSTAITNTSI